MQQGGRGSRKLPRYESHALIEVRTSFWNPFAVESAVLIDISWAGFKIEFVSGMEGKIRAGSKLRVNIPLSAFGILYPRTLRLKGVVRWFDARSSRAGGIFERPSGEALHSLEKVIHFVSSRSQPLA